MFEVEVLVLLEVAVLVVLEVAVLVIFEVAVVVALKVAVLVALLVELELSMLVVILLEVAVSECGDCQRSQRRRRVVSQWSVSVVRGDQDVMGPVRGAIRH